MANKSHSSCPQCASQAGPQAAHLPCSSPAKSFDKELGSKSRSRSESVKCSTALAALATLPDAFAAAFAVVLKEQRAPARQEAAAVRGAPQQLGGLRHELFQVDLAVAVPIQLLDHLANGASERQHHLEAFSNI